MASVWDTLENWVLRVVLLFLMVSGMTAFILQLAYPKTEPITTITKASIIGFLFTAVVFIIISCVNQYPKNKFP
jgi:hypothetical protein